MSEDNGSAPRRYIDDYSNKLILAPMVRANHLGFRLTCRDYGADIVYSEELIAQKLKDTKRVVNEEAGTVDFMYKNGYAVYRTCERDHPNVLQMGASNAVVALQAAQVVCGDVDGIDLNMGCPKHFSVHAGMGAALLQKPETVHDILTTLKRNTTNSITCKIRLLDTVSSTLDLMKMIESTGVSAIAVHARHVVDRPRDRANWEKLSEVVKSYFGVPLIVNGDVFVHEDIAKVREATNVSSVMIARGALYNASIFQPHMESVDDVIKRYLRNSMDIDQHPSTTKWNIMQMMQEMKKRNPNEQLISQSKTMKDLSRWFDLEDYYEQSTSAKLEKTTQAPPKKQKTEP
ncbi:hypothetical protein PROFUN_11840 [Planoprotostelium fungivorum]|uniref:tRNA-dihydrouridine synthase n=1 Tax=Planoprotostelium fungivorum TaxID=1890364 RepID=A0A2P6N992_9EUKA|nr:hypothetical protein PROFUN_11840 [Planoprotostelium fungivorum]